MIAVAIFAIILWRVNFAQIFGYIQHIDLAYLIAALLVLAIQVIVAAFRWIQLLKMSGFSFPLGRMIGAFAAGSFLNSTLPGGVGGDAMRIWYSIRNGVSPGAAVHIIILDRVVSLIGLGVLVLIAIACRWLVTGNPIPLIDVTAVVLSSGIIVATFGLILIEPIIKHFSITLPPVLMPIRNLSRAMHALRNPSQLSILIAIVMAVHLLLIAVILFLAWGMHVAFSPLDALMGLPTALLLSSLPITPGGWGIREGAMVLALAQFHIAAEVALGISVLFGIISLFANLPGALFWFAHRREVKEDGRLSEKPVTT